MGLFGYQTKKDILINDLKETTEFQGHKLQEMGDILTQKGLADLDKKYRGNEYTKYVDAVSAIDKKYNGTANWGIWSANIINVRSAFIIGKGLKVIKKEENADKEFEWVNDFMDFNKLKIALPIIYSNESEIEGKFLVQLYWDTVDEVPKLKARYMSWRNYGYTVIANPKDYLDFETIEYKESKGNEVKIQQENFTYRKFGGNIENPNGAKPNLWGSLTQIDDVDKALRDWRKCNFIHSNPFPVFECESEKEAGKINKMLESVNWRAGKAIATTAKVKYLSTDTNHSENIVKEVIAKLKTISGNTGVPVHFLGLPDLMSNRATADNLMELIWASTRREREIFEGAYTEMVRKAMLLNNEASKTQPGIDVSNFDPAKIEIQIPEISANEWENIQNVYLPLFKANAISLHTLLSKIPEIDIEDEEERVAKEKQENMDNFMIANKAMDNSKQQDEQNNNNNNNFNQENK